MAVRASVALLVLVFNEVFTVTLSASVNWIIRWVAIVGLVVNVPYYFAARRGWWRRAQAYGRMLLDVAFITVGLWSAGGLAAAAFVAIYAVVPVYVGLVFSSTACLVVTWAATAVYLLMAAALPPHGGPTPPLPGGWPVAAFNLLILNVVGGLTAVLAEAYRRSRLRLAQANEELERANAAAQRLNAEIQRAAQLRVLGEVVAGVTHEIGNVLSVALGHVGLARLKASGQPDILAHLDHIETSTDAAMRVVRNALETVRQSSAQQRPVSMASVAQRIVELKRHDLRKDGISVHLDFPEPFPLVLGTPFQVQQVLLNLVVNAQDALRAASTRRAIEIVGWPENERAVVEIRDTGPGIATEILPRLFEPFFTTKTAGTGLGLAVSAGIVRELGGELTAENRVEGGASFRITLPVLK
jgi:two-component system C4-dicarboxylate transport sensor histidine kinase DctB